MTTETYAAKRTGLLIVDPYNDFMSEGGKLYEAIKPTADASGMFDGSVATLESDGTWVQ